MAASPWSFYRGAAAVMASDLASRPDTGLTVQLCGDAHLLNFGLWATPERQLSFDLRDFDETLPGPFEWDVSRLVASIVVLARENGLKESVAERAVADCLRAYRRRIAEYARSKQLEIWYDLITVDQLIALFKPEEQEQVVGARQQEGQAAHERRCRAQAHRDDRRASFGSPRIHRCGFACQDDELALEEAVFAAYRSSLPEYRRHLLDRFSFVDAARQVVGVGSVGMRVFLVLLTGRDEADPLFLQIKQAGPSVYEAYRGESRHANHGERVVVGKRLIQSATDIFAGFTSVGARRLLRPAVPRHEGDSRAPNSSPRASRSSRPPPGNVLARAHARTGDAIAIDAYIGKGRRFDEALGEFAAGYADQTARDHQQLQGAVTSGAIESTDA